MLPSPDTLTYSLTLPAEPTSSHVARAVLQACGLADMVDAVVQVVGELAACACRFTLGGEVYVSLRFREGAMRVVRYDGHRRHEHPRLVAGLRRAQAGGVAGAGVAGAGV